jgi:hypothetical protein
MNKMTALRLLARLFAISFVVAHSVSVLAQSDHRTVFVQNNQICLSDATNMVRCITSDNRTKYLPVWSRDGNKIAYLEAGDNSSSLATAVVIDRGGKRLAGIPIKTLDIGEIRSGMRYVDSVEWISNNRLAVSGSVNPSSREYVVINLDTVRVTDEFVSDKYRASFSADGFSYAAVSGMPHFTPKDSHAPILIVNGQRLKGVIPGSVEIAGSPAWAPDGSTIAIPLRNSFGTPNEGVDSVVFWERSSGLTHLITAPVRLRDVRWGDTGLIAATMPDAYGQRATLGWKLPVTAKPFGMSSWQPVADPMLLNVDKRDQKLRTQLRNSLMVDGGINIDIWCVSCGLSNLPRRVPHDY